MQQTKLVEKKCILALLKREFKGVYHSASSCMIWASGVASVVGAGGGELAAGGLGGVGGVGAKLAPTSGVRAGPSVELVAVVGAWGSA
ncbi:hypothetical protein V6N13_007731 [Hibiscus sabdariffa]